MIRSLLMLVAAVSLGTAAQAQTFPKLTGRVVDAANLLSPEQAGQITAMSEATEQATGRQLVVATVPDLQGYPIEDFANRLFRHWKLGQSEADNGIMLLVAPKERRIRIEVGYGLEPIMTDALSGMIVRDTITPRFKAGDMGGGIVAGASAINEQLKLPLEAAEARAKQLIDAAPRQQQRRGGSGIDLPSILFIAFMLFFVVLPMVFGRAKGRRYRGGSAPVVIWGPGFGSGSSGDGWGGGFGGEGGFSGGGGSSGGGGASGGW